MTRLTNLEATWLERPITVHLQIQFGSTEVHETAEGFAAVKIGADGAREAGQAAQRLVPRWFDKRAHLTKTDTIEELRNTIRASVMYAPGLFGTALSIRRKLRPEVAAALSGTRDLAVGFGPALIEMAMIDALCRAKGVTFWRAAKGDLFGLANGAPEDPAADDITRSLAETGPPGRITLRHTIGIDAPLGQKDVDGSAPRNGLTAALDEVIARTGIRAFKIKLKGDPDKIIRSFARSLRSSIPCRSIR